MGTVIQGHVGIGPSVSGEALVAPDNFSARYDLDRIKGIFSRLSHKLHGESYVGKVLVLNAAKGGVATAWMLREMASRDMAPLALLLNYANPIIAQGAAFAEFPLVSLCAGPVFSAGSAVYVPACPKRRRGRACSAWRTWNVQHAAENWPPPGGKIPDLQDSRSLARLRRISEDLEEAC